MLIAVAAFAAVVSGCGGSSSSSADDSPSSSANSSGDHGYVVEADTTLTTANLDRAQFIARVDKICRQAWPIIYKNFTEYSATQDPRYSKKARFTEALHLSLLAGIDFHIFDYIYELGAPPGEEQEAEKVIGTLQSAVERGEKSLAPLATIPQAVKLFGEYNQRARDYGFTDECLVDRSHLRKLEA